MSYLLVGAGIFSLLYYKRRTIAYQTLKVYTILESKYQELIRKSGVKLIKEVEICNEDNKHIVKLIKFSYNGKFYHQFILGDEEPYFANIDSLDLLENYKSPILAVSITISHDNKIIESEKDITEYINSFILPKCVLELLEDNISIWSYLIKQEFNLTYESPITIEWSIIDRDVNFYKSKNIKIENNLDKLHITTIP